jgi:hypothetical protein
MHEAHFKLDLYEFATRFQLSNYFREQLIGENSSLHLKV